MSRTSSAFPSRVLERSTLPVPRVPALLVSPKDNTVSSPFIDIASSHFILAGRAGTLFAEAGQPGKSANLHLPSDTPRASFRLSAFPPFRPSAAAVRATIMGTISASSAAAVATW